MKIRDIEQRDQDAWSAMRTLLWPDTPDKHIGEISAFFAGESVDVVQVLVIEDDRDDLCGFLELNVRNFAEGSRNARVPYIEAWFVREDRRGRGYGKALMHAAEQWALARGYTELASDTELDNTTSIAMHKKLGFVETERVVCFLKRLR